MKVDIIKLGISIIICQAAGFIGSFFTASSISTWYTQINKPFFNPPDWIFGPVWITLYLLMGISLYLVWMEPKPFRQKRSAYILFAVQLALNSLWSILFFGLKSPFLAMIGIIILWSAILLTIILFWRISKTASYLLLPYIAWVTFAAILNLAIFLLN